MSTMTQTLRPLAGIDGLDERLCLEIGIGMPLTYALQHGEGNRPGVRYYDVAITDGEVKEKRERSCDIVSYKLRPSASYVIVVRRTIGGDKHSSEILLVKYHPMPHEDFVELRTKILKILE